MAKNIEHNILIYWLTSKNNTFKEVAKKYDVSIHRVKKIIDAYMEEKSCKHDFYEIDSWTGLKQCRFCDKLQS